VKWNPHEYQKIGIQWLLEHAGAGLILDPGMGKTSIALAALDILLAVEKIRKVLIIAPLRVCNLVWPLEVRKWDDFQHMDICNLCELDEKERIRLLKEDHEIYLINPESVKAITNPKIWAGQGFDCLVVDESTKFKDTQTQRFKALKPFLPQFKRRWILTGTPSPNGYEDLFGQMYIVDLGKALGRFITHYRAQYFRTDPFNEYSLELMPGAAKEIQELLRPSLIHFSDKDFLDLPELIHNPIYVDLPPTARKHYVDMERRFFTLLESGEPVFAPNAAVVGGKCRQICNGGLYTKEMGDKRGFGLLHSEKVKALLDLVEQLQGSPLLTSYEFQFDAETIERTIPRTVNMTTTRDMEAVNDAFNKGLIPHLVGHPASMAHGLNLQAACHNVCLYGITWNYEWYTQFLKRVYRQGNMAERVTLHWIIARNTLDEKVQRVLASKGASDDSIKNALKPQTQSESI
jgi:SNF2 family DNA or RNA helicase